MLSGRLELVAIQAKAQEKTTEVILGALRIKWPSSTACAPAVQSLRRHGKNELDSRLYFPGVQRRLEPSKLDGAAIPDVVEIDPW